MANEPERLAGLNAGVFQERLRADLASAYGCWHRAEGTGLDAETWFMALAGAVQAEALGWQDALALCRFALSDAPGGAPSDWATEVLSRVHCQAVIAAAIDALRPEAVDSPETANHWFHDLRRLLRDSHGLRGRDVMDVLRAALTGEPRGPCLGIVGALLGPDRIRKRLEEQRRCPASS